MKIAYLFAVFLLIFSASAAAVNITVHNTTETGLQYLYRFQPANVSTGLQNYAGGSCNMTAPFQTWAIDEPEEYLNGTGLFTTYQYPAVYPGITTTCGTYNMPRNGTIDVFFWQNASIRSAWSAANCTGTCYLFKDSIGHFGIQGNGFDPKTFIFRMSSPADGGTCSSQNITISDNEMHRYTLNWKADGVSGLNQNITTYWDNVYNYSVICNNTIGNVSDGQLGGISGSASFFKVVMDEFAQYNLTLTPQQIDGTTTPFTNATCSDGTANQTCSTSSTPFFCSNTTTSGSPRSIPALIYDANSCPCPFGQVGNGTACVATSTQPKVQVPVDLVAWDEASCIGFASGADQCSCFVPIFGIGGTCPAGQTTEGDYLIAKYLATADKRPIVPYAYNLNRTDVVNVNYAQCQAVDYYGNYRQNMVFDNDTLQWKSSALLFQNFDNTLWRVECGSSLPNSNLSSVITIGNTKQSERAVIPFSKSGLLPKLDNTATDLDSPITFRYEIQKLAVGVSSYSASTCALTVENQSLFNASTGDVVKGNIFSTGNVAKTEAGTTATSYEQTIFNSPSARGDYAFNWLCAADATKRQPSVASRESLTVNGTCLGPKLSAFASVIYDMLTNDTKPADYPSQRNFYYGSLFMPSLTYQTVNGSQAPRLSDFGECSLRIAGVTNASFSLGPFSPVKNGAFHYFIDLPDYMTRNGPSAMPIGNYSLVYTCRSIDKSFCAAPVTFSSLIGIFATPGGCSGTADSCGFNTCLACGNSQFACEKSSIYQPLACYSQECVADVSSGAAKCAQLGLQTYSLKAEVQDAAQGITCGSPIQVSAQLLNNTVPITTGNATCTIKISRNSRTLAGTNQPIQMTGGIVSKSFDTGPSGLECGQDVQADIVCQCDQIGCLGAKTASVPVQILRDTRCVLRDKLVLNGCVVQTTKDDNDRPLYCSADGAIFENAIACGCPAGMEANTTSPSVGNSTAFRNINCVSKGGASAVDSFIGWFTTGAFLTGGVVIFIIIIWPFLGHFLEKIGLLGLVRKLFSVDEEPRRRRREYDD